MKYIFYLIVLMIINLCQSQSPFIPVDRFDFKDTFKKMRKSLIDCILTNSKSSENLKKYATEVSSGINIATLNLEQFKNEESDYNIIKQCRRQSFQLRTNMLPSTGRIGHLHVPKQLF